MTADLSTKYLGLDLRSPVVASASPLTGEVDSAVAIARAGAGALVMPSLWEEEVLEEELALNRGLETGSQHFAEALTYFPAVDELLTAADRYCQTLSEIKQAVDVPVIASLNASSAGGWIHYAKELEAAGADALELEPVPRRRRSDGRRSGGRGTRHRRRSRRSEPRSMCRSP